ncbi:MAG: winged helix-turn-helix transcriptional regulator [Candidatus Glassbacteria bacterium]|nr:winged helix-turn-helix transcriptional regulator [Candidatus Glassbacteria bacterium]
MFGKFDLLLPGRLIRELLLMVEVEHDPSISQSRLGTKIGLVPSMVNGYIRRMSEQGYLVKAGASHRRTTYHLTERGRVYCAELMKRYSIETVRLYKYAKQEIRRRVAGNFNSHRSLRIALYGAAETGELAYQVCLELGHQVVGVVDRDTSRQGQHMQGCRVSDPAELIGMQPEVVFITSMGHASEIAAQLEPLRESGVRIFSLDHCREA